MITKTIVDYLNKGNFNGVIGNCDITLEMQGDKIKMICDEKEYIMDAFITSEYEIRDILETMHKTEIRFCEECGK